ncbi:hypothetical protein HY797_02040, partial [Candidatus Falkowbacteria bacterium]|nr:hypothetical protein [Candidatus Falkowbacteria bacterium]
EAKIEKEGGITVPNKLITNIVSYIPDGDVLLSSNEQAEFFIETAQSKTKIHGIPASEFPSIPTVEKKNELVISSKDFIEPLLYCVFCASRNSSRPVLNGVLLQYSKTDRDLVMVATDSFRLSEKKIALEQECEDFNIIIPANTMEEVLRILILTGNNENVILKMKPNIIYTHQPNDLNIDHQIVFKAVLTACRPQPGCVVKKILGFETVSSTEWQIKDQAHCFCPTEYVDILEFIERKIKILEQAYGKELRPYPHPRSKEGVKIFAQYRGLEVGLKFAEAFCLIRNIR